MHRRDSTPTVLDPALAPLNAPDDDEPETPEEARAVAEAKTDPSSYSLAEARKLLDL